MRTFGVFNAFFLILLILSIIMGNAVTGLMEPFPKIPSECYGNVTVDGIPAPVGTKITAITGDEMLGTLVVARPGQYGRNGSFEERLYILAPNGSFTEEGSAQNSVVSFLIDSLPACETLIYEPGTCYHLDLTAHTPQKLPDTNNSTEYQDANRHGAVITLCRGGYTTMYSSLVTIPVRPPYIRPTIRDQTT